MSPTSSTPAWTKTLQTTKRKPSNIGTVAPRQAIPATNLLSTAFLFGLRSSHSLYHHVYACRESIKSTTLLLYPHVSAIASPYLLRSRQQVYRLPSFRHHTLHLHSSIRPRARQQTLVMHTHTITLCIPRVLSILLSPSAFA